ncbi:MULTISPECIES: O-antigen ligase family protein [unclassified Agrococcus]|uniref:O-antigen ligase family protein n=1 Tax=unclassified Agrococcus TaxID=2615065 RepID=UPI003619798F
MRGDARGTLVVVVAGAGGAALVAAGLGPIAVAAVAALGGALWLARQGVLRLALGLVLLTTLGAASTVEAWAAASTYGRLAALALLVVAVLREPAPAGEPSRSQRWLLGALLAIAGVATATALWSIDVAATLEQALLLWILVAVVALASRRRWRDADVVVGDVRVVVAVVAAVLAAGLAGHALGLVPLPYGGRFQGLLANPNMAAQVSTLAIFLSLVVLRRRRSWMAVACLAASVATIVLSESRTALLAVAVGVAWMAVLAGARGVVAVVGLVVATGCAATMLGPSPLRLALDRFGDAADRDGLSGRSSIWAAAVDAIAARPHGWGWGTTEAVLAGAHRAGATRELAQSFHGSVLQVAVEGGLLAAALLVVAYAATVAPMLRLRAHAVPAALSGLVAAGIVAQVSESGVFGTGQPFPYLFWFGVAALLGLDDAARRGATVPDARRLVAR